MRVVVDLQWIEAAAARAANEEKTQMVVDAKNLMVGLSSLSLLSSKAAKQTQQQNHAVATSQQEGIIGADTDDVLELILLFNQLNGAVVDDFRLALGRENPAVSIRIMHLLQSNDDLIGEPSAGKSSPINSDEAMGQALISKGKVIRQVNTAIYTDFIARLQANAVLIWSPEMMGNEVAVLNTQNSLMSQGEVMDLSSAMPALKDLGPVVFFQTDAKTDTSAADLLFPHAQINAEQFLAKLLVCVRSAHDAKARKTSTKKIRLLQSLADIFIQGSNDDNLLRATANCLAINESTLAYTGNLPVYRWRIEGLFDSSYSLAILNREIARALVLLGQDVSLAMLHSTEKPGELDPDPEFMRANPDIKPLCNRSAPAWVSPDIVTRNMYPPRVTDMGAKTKLLINYAWEESGFPQAFTDSFNETLDGITCVSQHVKKIFIDNGVTLPLTVNSNGVDHWDRIQETRYALPEARAFRFLHVSSCFPRKGVDSLLAAWGQAFSNDDDVTLVIKTFDNPHNNVRELLAAEQQKNPNYPHVILIICDLSDSQLKGLYRACHVLVAPSKAEGFGLPLAEALLTGLPVITTAWGGQLDFCHNEATRLIDYRLERADTHFNLSESLWAAPDVDDLTRAMKEMYAANPVQMGTYVAQAARELRDKFSWERVSCRLLEQTGQIIRYRQNNDIHKRLRIGWVSTWNQRCGIAAFSRHLVEQNQHDHLFILAPFCDELQGSDEVNVLRCWRPSYPDDLLALETTARRLQLDVLVIQANIDFFCYPALERLVKNLKQDGVVVTLTMHSTQPPEEAVEKSMESLLPVMQQVDRVIVHSPDDMNRLKPLGVMDRLALMPLGVPDVKPELPSERLFSGRRVIAAYGFAMPHKGFAQLLEAFVLLCEQHNDLALLLLNAEHTNTSSPICIAQLRERIDELGNDYHIYMDNHFMSDAQTLGYLSQSKVIVMPYQNTGESSSAAVKMALAAQVPVLVTPLSIFGDVLPAVEMMDGVTIEDIAAGIDKVLSGQRVNSVEKVEEWRRNHTYPVVSKRMFGLLRALWINRNDLLE